MKKNSGQKNKFVFGPVLSRRLGISLGVDILPPKSCTYDCIYCECGSTTSLGCERKEYIPAEEVIAELDEVLSSSVRLDYITFSGCGEPTLNSALGEIIDFINQKYPACPIAVLTNGSLLYLQEVRRAISGADVVVPSLDAVSGRVFKKINRPCPGLTPERVVEGIEKIARELKAKVWVELFIIPSVNDTPEELAKIKEALRRINPARIHLNTLDRPGTEEHLQPASIKQLKKVQKFMRPLESTLIPAARPDGEGRSEIKNLKHEITALLARRPSTFKDLKTAFASEEKVLKNCLQELENSGKIHKVKKKRGVFYKKL